MWMRGQWDLNSQSSIVFISSAHDCNFMLKGKESLSLSQVFFFIIIYKIPQNFAASDRLIFYGNVLSVGILLTN